MANMNKSDVICKTTKIVRPACVKKRGQPPKATAPPRRYSPRFTTTPGIAFCNAAAPPAVTLVLKTNTFCNRLSPANCAKPEYPSASRRLEEEGTVSLRFLVGTDGKVIESEVEKTSGYKRLDEAARAALSRCQFRAATVDGKPEQGWATMKYTWRLE